MTGDQSRLPKTTDGKIALIAFAAWLFVALPLIYLPSSERVHGEILGVKYGEWLLFAATMGLWWATWRLVRSSEKTAERQLRAYVFVRPIGTRFLYEDDTCRVTITYGVKNTGQTPAFQLLHFGEICNLMVPTATKIMTPPLNGPLSAISLGPGAEIEGTVWGIMGIKKLKELGTSFKKIHVVGTAIYIDAFKQRRETEFCFYVENLREILASHKVHAAATVNRDFGFLHNITTRIKNAYIGASVRRAVEEAGIELIPAKGNGVGVRLREKK